MIDGKRQKSWQLAYTQLLSRCLSGSTNNSFNVWIPLHKYGLISYYVYEHVAYCIRWKHFSTIYEFYQAVIFMILSQQRSFFESRDDVIKWKHFPRYWPFVRGIQRSPVNSPHKGQWQGALMFSLICARINDWVNNREAGDLRRRRAHYDATVMIFESSAWFGRYLGLYTAILIVSTCHCLKWIKQRKWFIQRFSDVVVSLSTSWK